MVRWTLLGVLVMGCRPLPEARGTLVFSVDIAVGDAGVSDSRAALVLVTEAEVLQSRLLAQRVVEKLGLASHPSFTGKDAVTAVRGELHASRRGETLLVDVQVRDENRALAVLVCNAVMEAYLDGRASAARARHLLRQKWLSEQLENEGHDSGTEATLRAALTGEALAAGLYQSDVRVLEPCSTSPAR